MRDSFNDITKSYQAALSTIAGVNVYGLIAPPSNADKYILHSIVSAVSDDTMTCSGQDVTVQVSIIHNTQNGKASEVNDIAMLVYEKIYKNPAFNLNIPNCQNVTTNLEYDRLMLLPIGQNVQVQRIIHFSHKIYFN